VLTAETRSRVPNVPIRHDLGATALLAAASCGLGVLYLWHGLAPRAPGGEPAATRWFGVDQWAFAGRGWLVLFVLAAVVAGMAIACYPEPCRRAATAAGRALDHRWMRLALAAATTLVCWSASTRQENLDGSLLQQKIAEAVPRAGAFVTHDEMLELYLHSRLWAVLNAAWGWDVAQTYRATSCLAGGAAALLALGLARRYPPARRLLVVTGLFAGGWVLVFFGDVENYTVTNVLVLGYLAAALRFLDTERARLWPVAALLAAAVLFHLEALILGPSLLVLAATARRRSGRDALGSVALVPTVLGLALWWFNDHGLPIGELLTHSQISADGGNWAAFVARPDLGYLWRQLQLLLLLAPTVVLLPALLVGRTPGRSPHVPFLATASAGGLLLVFVWRAQLGVVDDWNLYALAAQPLGLLVLGWLATEPRLRTRAPWITVMVVLAATHTAAWIAENHTPVTG
jgi:hypothetical protein